MFDKVCITINRSNYAKAKGSFN